jgi:hypothetical protein
MPLLLSDILNEDLDVLFSYQTKRYVIISDFFLGVCHKVICFLIGVYFVVGILWMDQEYLKSQKGYGLTHV